MLSLQDMPKAEIHLHLEGAIEPETILELDPSLTLEEVRSRYKYVDFTGFIESFKWVNSFLRTPEDYALITTRLCERLRSQNVVYAEVILAAGVILWKKQDVLPVFDAVHGAALASGLEVNWIFDAVRQFGAGHAMQVAEFAAQRMDSGVVAIGIGGSEEKGPAGWFTEVYKWARSRGLHLHAHAGETCGPESVWKALEIGTERIGHGIRSIEDTALVRHLADKRIPLEVCITSNIATGAVRSLAEHPVRRLYDAGVPIVLNSDDPSMFHTTLTNEYELARKTFGFSDEELAGLGRNSFQFCFR
jgi:adenosine deaminase/aminodeoxyfutalosine deaminase